MSDRNDDRPMYFQDGYIEKLREEIYRCFPADAYGGKITNYDNRLDEPDMDDEKDLYESLSGRRWTEVPQELIARQPDGYVLLTDEAFRAFFPAWLMSSIENLQGENRVKDFVVYSFSPRHDMVPDTTSFILRRLELLNPAQRDVLRSLLKLFAEWEASAFQKRLAFNALVLLDTFEELRPGNN